MSASSDTSEPPVSGPIDRGTPGAGQLLVIMLCMLINMMDGFTVTLLLRGAFFLSFGALYFLPSWLPKLMTDAGLDADIARQSAFLFNPGVR